MINIFCRIDGELPDEIGMIPFDSRIDKSNMNGGITLRNLPGVEHAHNPMRPLSIIERIIQRRHTIDVINIIRFGVFDLILKGGNFIRAFLNVETIKNRKNNYSRKLGI